MKMFYLNSKNYERDMIAHVRKNPSLNMFFHNLIWIVFILVIASLTIRGATASMPQDACVDYYQNDTASFVGCMNYFEGLNKSTVINTSKATINRFKSVAAKNPSLFIKESDFPKTDVFETGDV